MNNLFTKMFKSNRSKLFRNINKRTKSFLVGDILADEFSACKPQSYTCPKSVEDWLKHGRMRFRKLFSDINADRFNYSAADNLIAQKIQPGIDSLVEQNINNKRTIKDISRAQKSRVNRYQLEHKKCIEEINIIKSKYPDIDSSDAKYVAKRQRARIPFYKTTICLVLVLASGTLLDYTTVFSSVDSLLTQNIFLSILLSIGIAGLNNLAPSIAGVYAKNKDLENRKMIMSILWGIFIALFVVLCGLRWTTRDALFSDTNALFVSAEKSYQTYDSAEIFMIILLMIEPALTSCLSFVFGYIGVTLKEKEKALDEKQLCSLSENKDEYEIRISELMDVLDGNDNLTENEECYSAALERMSHYTLLLEEEARIAVAEKEKNPEANGLILQRERAISY